MRACVTLLSLLALRTSYVLTRRFAPRTARTRARTASTGKGLRGNSSITDEEKKARVSSKRLSQSLHDLIGVGRIKEDDKKVKKLTRDQKLMLGAWEDCDMMQVREKKNLGMH